MCAMDKTVLVLPREALNGDQFNRKIKKKLNIQDKNKHVAGKLTSVLGLSLKMANGRLARFKAFNEPTAFLTFTKMCISFFPFSCKITRSVGVRKVVA